jgi:tRNA pseudouridine55 synthase
MTAAPAAGGILNLLKPPGMTSHDVVNLVRRALGTRKVGHTGTLDPGVPGVLPICVGRATRLAEYVAGSDKAYRAEVRFGLVTDTLDSFGTVLQEQDASSLTERQVAEALASFAGEILQVPPMVSAVRVGGKRLYELARQGLAVERAARPVTILSIRLLRFQPGPAATATIDVVCSKGTYIRALADDLGALLGVGGSLSYLVRTRSGPFRLEDSFTLEELAAGEARLLPPAAALGEMPRVKVGGRAAEQLRHGVLPRESLPDGITALVAPDGELLALAEQREGAVRLLKVFV